MFRIIQEIRGGNDKILLEWNNFTNEHAQLEVKNENDSTGLTTIFMDGLDFDDVSFAKGGDTLEVTMGSTSLVQVEDFYADRAVNAAEGAQTTAFEFDQNLLFPIHGCRKNYQVQHACGAI